MFETLKKDLADAEAVVEGWVAPAAAVVGNGRAIAELQVVAVTEVPAVAVPVVPAVVVAEAVAESVVGMPEDKSGHTTHTCFAR